MQQNRREFVKKSAMVVGASVAVGAATIASGRGLDADSNNVVVGSSSKKEVIYKKTDAWKVFYKQAKL